MESTYFVAVVYSDGAWRVVTEEARGHGAWFLDMQDVRAAIMRQPAVRAAFILAWSSTTGLCMTVQEVNTTLRSPRSLSRMVVLLERECSPSALRNLAPLRQLVARCNAEFAPRCVLQDWVVALPMMQQTVLLTAVRGPDGIEKYGPCKSLLRWYRRCILYSATDGSVLSNPYDSRGGSFTGPSYDVADPRHAGQWQPRMDEIVGQYLRVLDAVPHHFHLHLMHAVEIVGYKHSDQDIRAWWGRVYVRLVRDMHLYPEPESALDERLGDDRDGWLAHADPATVS